MCLISAMRFLVLLELGSTPLKNFGEIHIEAGPDGDFPSTHTILPKILLWSTGNVSIRRQYLSLTTRTV